MARQRSEARTAMDELELAAGLVNQFMPNIEHRRMTLARLVFCANHVEHDAGRALPWGKQLDRARINLTNGIVAETTAAELSRVLEPNRKGTNGKG